MGSDLHVGVVGATGAVGAEIVGVLDRVSWRPERLVAAASPTTTAHFVEYGDHNVPVDDSRHLDMGDLDLVFLAAPPEVSREVGERALADGVAVVDVSGAFAHDDDVPVVVPWVNPEALQQVGMRQIVSMPSGPALLLGAVLSPLVRAGVIGEVHATVNLPASAWGRAGIDELSRQVVTLFNAGTPPRKVFPRGLAFDTLPALGPVGDDGWTERENQVVAELQRLLGVELPISATLIGVPVFSGMTADVSLRLHRRVMPDLVERILSDAGLKLPEEAGERYLPRPRRVEGQPLVHVARIRTRDQGSGLHLWVAMDNLRATATAAVGLAGALMRERLQPRD